MKWTTLHRDEITFLISGIGSIGQRHLNNLIALGHRRIILHNPGFDSVPRALPESFIAEDNLEAALSHGPDAVIIANPSASHMETALQAASYGAHLFIEKPLSHSIDGVSRLQRIIGEKQLMVQMGFQFRFHPGLIAVRNWLREGEIGMLIHAESHWGEFLPSWHPWEDYRRGYSARTDLGGGVLLTLCHPFDYLRWLIGEVAEVSAMIGQRSGLEIDTEDIAQISLRFQNGVIGSVHLNYSEYPQRHFLTLIGQKGRIDWHPEGSAVLTGIDGREKQHFKLAPDFSRNTMFLKEISSFIDSVRHYTQPDCTLEDGISNLNIALAVKRAAAEKRTIPVTANKANSIAANIGRSRI